MFNLFKPEGLSWRSRAALVLLAARSIWV